MSTDTVIFAVSALVAVFGAVMMISQRNPVGSVLYLILSLVAQAALYVQLGAMFMGAVLIIVYAGAVMVLFLFVIMLLNLRGSEDSAGGSSPVSIVTKYTVAVLLVIELAFVIKSGFFPDAGATGLISVPSSDFGSVESVARLLFEKYLYPFELTSILIIAAIVGAVVIAKRVSDGPTEEGEAEIVSIPAFLIVAVVLFGVGTVGVLASRNVIILLMSVELMLNAANLALIAFSRALNVADGHVLVFLVLAVAAAEAAVGLAMVITVYRNRDTINIDRFNMLKW